MVLCQKKVSHVRKENQSNHPSLQELKMESGVVASAIRGLFFSIDPYRVEVAVDSTLPLSSKYKNGLFHVLYRFRKAVPFLLTVTNACHF